MSLDKKLFYEAKQLKLPAEYKKANLVPPMTVENKKGTDIISSTTPNKKDPKNHINLVLKSISEQQLLFSTTLRKSFIKLLNI
jgi:hypothetical protein